MKQWRETSELGRLVLLRPEADPPTEASRKRVAALVAAGAQAIPVEPQQLAELAAFHVLLMGAQNGSLTRKGKPVEVAELDGWARANLSRAVKELLDQVFGPTGPALSARSAARAAVRN